MIKFIYTLAIVCLLSSIVFGQRVTNVSAEYDDRSGDIIIYYDLISYSGEEEFYEVKAFYSEDNGETFIQIQNGDGLGDQISSGEGNIIRWDFFVENPEFNGKDVVFKVEAKWNKSFEIKRLRSLGGTESALNSLLIPGWGHEKVTGKKGHWWTTAAIYGITGAGIYFAFSADDTYKEYRRAQDNVEAADLLDKANRKGKISLALVSTGATLWLSNMIWVAIRGSKNKKQLNSLLSTSQAPPILLGYQTQTQSVGFQLNFKF